MMRDANQILLTYRPDIDGLRAIAIIAVVLFHADFAFAKGGFIGVDIFFVISGFLITSILARGHSAGMPGLGQFYERRARRIIPAISAMLMAVMVGGFLLFPPNQFDQTAKAILATLLFGANFFFWQTSSYFGPESALNPLTHMWSLGVEEQFYVVFPLCLWLVLRYLYKFRLAIVLCIAVMSFGLSYWLTSNHPPSAFYMLPARAWELLIGSSLALGISNWPLRSLHRQLLGIAGIFLIAVGFAVINTKTAYPGFHALLPVVGTAALLAAGGEPGSVATRVFSSPILVAIGLRSYSIYLWHWPVLVLTKTYRGEIYLGIGHVIAAILIGLFLAELSYRLVERRFRDRRRIALSAVVYAVTAISLLLAASSAAVLWQNGMAWRFTPQVVRLDADVNAYSVQSKACFAINGAQRFGRADACRLGPTANTIRFVLWGDSHAGAIAPSLAALATAHSNAGYLAAMSSCPPFLAIGAGSRNQNAIVCEKNNSHVLNSILASKNVDTVFLFASWQRYYDEDPVAMKSGLKKLAKTLQQFGKTVVLIHGMPRPDIPVPWVLARKSAADQSLPLIPRPAELWLKTVTAGTGIATANLSEALCRGQNCALERSGRSLYADSSHLSQPANELVITPWLDSKFANWPKPAVLP
jgi:peptidoglycan/LPS O-acetylase OafA/YrhL